MKTQFTKSKARKIATCHPEYGAGYREGYADGLLQMAFRIAAGWTIERETIAATDALKTFETYVADYLAELKSARR